MRGFGSAWWSGGKAGVVARVVVCAGAAAGVMGCATGSSGAKAGSRSVLQLFSPPTPQEAAAWAIDPYDADKRQRGLLLLANAPWGGADVYVELYRAALDDGDNGVKASAIKALALHGGPEDAERIAVFLVSDDRLVRWESAQALQRLHNPVVVPALMERLDPRKESDYDVRAAAATALGQYAERRVLDSLMGALDDPNLLVNTAAEGSLRTLTGKDLGDDVRAWVEWTKGTEDPFAGRLAYVYPVFHRDKTLLEWVVPFMAPPNEIAAAPAGMPAMASTPGGPEAESGVEGAGSAEQAGETVRQN
jgi:hypothetical protein